MADDKELDDFAAQVQSEVIEILNVGQFADTIGGGGRRASGDKYSKKKGVDSERKKKRKRKKRVDRHYLLAQGYAENDKVKKAICGALLTVSDDLFDVAKNLTIVLFSLSLAGAIPVPLKPAIYAALALVISKTGINAYCADYR